MSAAFVEKSLDGSDLDLDAGIAGEHRIDGFLHLRCEAGLSPEFVGTGPQRLPCRKVDRIGAGLALLPLDTPAGFHERVRAQPLRFRPQRVHGLSASSTRPGRPVTARSN